MTPVSPQRISELNRGHARQDGSFVLYWMTSARRLSHNFALDRALEWCLRIGKPLVILEALRCGYPWASDRFHAFVLEGMSEHARKLARSRVTYYPYVEPEPGRGRGLLEALARQACVIVTDSFPGFFIPRMQEAAAARIDVLVEAVDSNGLLPLAAAPRAFQRAVDFRRYLQRELLPHLLDRSSSAPLRGLRLPALSRLPEAITRRWPPTPAAELAGEDLLRTLPIDHGVGRVDRRGGTRPGLRRLGAFLDAGLGDYGGKRLDPVDDGTSGLSPYLHFGHLSAHQVLAEIAARHDWAPEDGGGVRNGARAGWWGLPEPVEGFLDQLVTWRELGYVFCDRVRDPDRYESLPGWARTTLEDHLHDPRPRLYGLETLESASTDDPLWNAAQRQLVQEGRMHSYLRMLWGKRVLEWTLHPAEAVHRLFELNNRYALDGRDPNSVSGIMWTFGRFDRAWGPERPIFGKVRYMSSENTYRKLKLQRYLEEYA